jgi:hypothetical protein
MYTALIATGVPIAAETVAAIARGVMSVHLVGILATAPIAFMIVATATVELMEK